MPFKTLFTSIILLFSLPHGLRAGYEFNENCQGALKAIMDLRMATARDLLKQERLVNPDNHYTYYLDNLSDVYELVITTDRDAYDTFREAYKERRAIMDGQFEDSPHYLIVEAEMQLEYGIVNIIYGDRLSGLRNAYGGYTKTQKSIKRHPDMMANQKLEGMFNFSIANLPPFVKWAAAAFGVHGDDETGERIMKSYYKNAQSVTGLEAEAALFNIFAFKLSKDPKKAYDFLQTLDSNLIFNHSLLHYFHANIAYNVNRNDEAIESLKKFNLDKVEIAFDPYYYMWGKIKFRQLEAEARDYLNTYLSNEEEEDYIKELNYKLAVINLCEGDTSAYTHHIHLAKSTGSSITERDREAYYDATLDYIPDINLLNSKRLMNGGYYEGASKYLHLFKVTPTTPLAHKLEYQLLQAKLDLHNEKPQQAEIQLSDVISKGSGSSYYFAAEAALVLGQMHEGTEDQLALSYYEKSLKLFDDSYYEYIEAKAEKAIERIKNAN